MMKTKITDKREERGRERERERGRERRNCNLTLRGLFEEGNANTIYAILRKSSKTPPKRIS